MKHPKQDELVVSFNEQAVSAIDVALGYAFVEAIVGEGAPKEPVFEVRTEIEARKAEFLELSVDPQYEESAAAFKGLVDVADHTIEFIELALKPAKEFENERDESV